MAPVKRSKTDVSNAKRLKSDPMLKGVTDSIELSGLPADVKRMLLKLAPLSFATPVDERHDFQTKVVDMVGEIVVQVQNKMRQDIDAKEEAASERSRAREELLSVVRHAEVAKAEKVSASEDLASSLGEITKCLVDKRLDWQVAKDDQRVGDSKHAADVAAAEGVKQVVDAHLVPIVVGGLDQNDAEGHFQALMPLIVSLKLDSSLNSALETTCTKPGFDRSSFDKLVIQELESALFAHLDTLQGVVSSGIPALTSRAAAVEVTSKEHDAWQYKQDTAAAALSVAQQVVHEACNTLTSAQEAVTQFDVEHADAVRELTEKKAEYENFLLWNVECYNMLKDKVSRRCSETVTVEASKLSDPTDETCLVASAEAGA